MVIQPPVFISNRATVRNSVLGPYATIADDAVVENAIIRNSTARPGDVPCLIKFDGVGADAAEGGFGTPLPFNRVEAAYARSVVWCNGFSVFLREERFPDVSALAGMNSRRT